MPPVSPVRIILVDDDPLTRAAIKPLLRPREDYVVVAEAGDGRQAIDAVGRVEADIVLMDLGMPVMDGIEATRQICRAPRHPHVRGPDHLGPWTTPSCGSSRPAPVG